MRKAFVMGGGFGDDSLLLLKALTNVQKPRVCYISPGYAPWWRPLLRHLGMIGISQEINVDSHQQKTFTQVFEPCDAFVVSGGNTLNQVAMMKAQGIDAALLDRYTAGAVVAGASAGASCWFSQALTDSRPCELSLINGFGFLPWAFSPHFDAHRRQKLLYYHNIGQLYHLTAYGAPDGCGIIFEDEQVKDIVGGVIRINPDYSIEELPATLEIPS